jgi:hypothetical protein
MGWQMVEYGLPGLGDPKEPLSARIAGMTMEIHLCALLLEATPVCFSELLSEHQASRLGERTKNGRNSRTPDDTPRSGVVILHML